MSARFCSQCGAELIIAPAAGRDRPQCPACGFIVYRNPIPVAMAVVEKDGCLLLIRRGNAPLQGYWAPPAGYVEIDESVEAAAVREAREEAGVQVALDGLTGVYSQAGLGILIVAYHGRVVAGEAVPSEDAVGAAYFAPGQLPPHPRPEGGTALDDWFHGVLAALTQRWRGTAT